MKPYSRSDRVAGLIQQMLAELLQKEISDPQLAKVTITAVQMSRDLRIAKIYFATAGKDGAAEAAMEGFNRARGFVKRELAQRLELLVTVIAPVVTGPLATLLQGLVLPI